MLPLELGELRENTDTDFASVKTIHGQTFVILPFRSTGLGAYRAHFVETWDVVPESAFDWREHGVNFLAFPYGGQHIVSVYRSNSGIVRIQMIQPTPQGEPQIHYLGETSEASARGFVKNMEEITRW
jgi:hypothetical protein